MIRTDKRMRLCVALLIANLIFIWGNSLLPGEISGAFSRWVGQLLGMSGTGTGGGRLRKLAHFMEFCALGMCLRWLFGMLLQSKRRPLLLPLGAGFLTACMDETIQMFVPGRGPGIKDVGIDTAGVAVGIVFISIIYQTKKYYHKEKYR